MSNKLKNQLEEKFENISDESQKKFNESYEHGKEKYEQGKEKAEELAKTSKQKVEELADKAEDKVYSMQDSANKLLKEGKKKIGEVQDQFMSNADELIQVVKEKPLVSLLVAGGVGYLLSMLARK